MSAQFFMACERLLGATANGIYQGLIVAVFAALALSIFARTNAATRHAVWFGVLLFVAALIPAHLLLSVLPRQEILPAAQRAALGETDIASTASPDVAAAGAPTAISDLAPDDFVAGGTESALSCPATGLPDEGAGGKFDSRIPVGAEAKEWSWWKFAKDLFKPLVRNLETAIRLPRAVCVCLVSLWVLLATIRGGLIARGIGEVLRAKAASSAPSESLQRLFDRLRASLATRREVRLRLSSRHRTAVLLGFLHPVILLPRETDNDPDDREVEHVLRHELAHLDRRDDWGNLAQQIIQAALFFHPAVWWISRRLSLEREIACDDRVLTASGRPRDYALTLANAASRMVPGRHALAPGVSNNRSQLKQRINMILNTRRDHSPRLALCRLGLFTITTAMLATVAIAAAPRLVVAQSASDTPPPPPNAPDAPATPATLPPDAAVESGPRSKRNRMIVDYAPALGDLPSHPAVAATPPTPPTAPVAAEPAERPAQPAPPSARPRKRNTSVEERLDRLERVLEELEARDGMKANLRDDALPAEINAKNAARRAGEDSKRAAEMAQRAAEAGQRNAERAMRDLAKLKEKDFERMQENLSELEAEAPQKALQALRMAHESLAKQLQDLERQIQRLEQDQNRPKKPGKVWHESSDETPKAKELLEQSN